MLRVIMPYISYLKWAGIALLVLLLGVQTLRVSNRDTTIAEQNTIISQDNSTIDWLQKDQAAKKIVIEALQTQATADAEAFETWKKNNTKIQNVVTNFVSVPADAIIAKNEVIDEKSSAAAIAVYNSISARLLFF